MIKSQSNDWPSNLKHLLYLRCLGMWDLIMTDLQVPLVDRHISNIDTHVAHCQMILRLIEAKSHGFLASLQHDSDRFCCQRLFRHWAFLMYHPISILSDPNTIFNDHKSHPDVMVYAIFHDAKVQHSYQKSTDYYKRILLTAIYLDESNL